MCGDVPCAGDMHSCDFIPVIQKGGLLAIDIGQDCSKLNVAVPHKTPSAPVAEAEGRRHALIPASIITADVR